jgi:hypothetical protein
MTNLFTRLNAALVELSDDEDDDGWPVIIAWRTDRLAAKLADMLTDALVARAAGVVADYQGDPRVGELRQMWPELADAIDDLVDIWHRSWEGPAAAEEGICGDVRPYRGRLHVCDLPLDHEDDVHQQSGGITWRPNGSV